jgi:hypothetical protein
VAGSGQLEERTEAVRWEVKSKDDRAFMGYVIELAA